MTALVVMLAGLLACSASAPPSTPGVPAGCASPLVLAASDLRAAFDELGDLYAARSGCRPTFSFGSSGAFATQLRQGARADAFFSAGASYVDELDRAGLIRAGSRYPYAVGRLALVAPPGKAPPASVVELADPAWTHVAIANPEHAPYGKAAEEALGAEGVLEAVRPRLVLGENVSQTLQLVDTGNADAGIVALSLVKARAGARYTVVDEALHARVLQVAAVPVAAEHPDAGRAFLDLVVSPEGQTVLARFGFASAAP